jgi:hypothetical protein
MHDPTKLHIQSQPNSLQFKPERFLDPVTRTRLSAFKSLAFASVRATSHCTRHVGGGNGKHALAVFEFLLATDAEGHPVPREQGFTSLFASYILASSFEAKTFFD